MSEQRPTDEVVRSYQKSDTPVLNASAFGTAVLFLSSQNNLDMHKRLGYTHTIE